MAEGLFCGLRLHDQAKSGLGAPCCWREKPGLGAPLTGQNLTPDVIGLAAAPVAAQPDSSWLGFRVAGSKAHLCPSWFASHKKRFPGFGTGSCGAGQ